MDEDRRRDKLDDALLFLMGSVGILFGVIQVFVGFSTLIQFIAPVAILGWILPFYFGFLHGAMRDSMIDRYRGWIYLVVGLAMYSYILAQEEISPLVAPGLQWTIALGFSPLIFLFLLRLQHLRTFVLGTNFPSNEVFRNSTDNALFAAVIVAVFGGLFAVAKFQSVSSLIFAVPLASIGIGIAGLLMFRSRRWANKLLLKYRIVEKNGRYHGHRNVERATRIIQIVDLAFGLTGTVVLALWRYFATQSISYYLVGAGFLGWTLILLVPSIILSHWTRSTKVIVFEEPTGDKLPVNYPI